MRRLPYSGIVNAFRLVPVHSKGEVSMEACTLLRAIKPMDLKLAQSLYLRCSSALPSSRIKIKPADTAHLNSIGGTIFSFDFDYFVLLISLFWLDFIQKSETLCDPLFSSLIFGRKRQPG